MSDSGMSTVIICSHKEKAYQWEVSPSASSCVLKTLFFCLYWKKYNLFHQSLLCDKTLSVVAMLRL